MNPDQILAHLKRLGSSLSTRQLLTLAAAFVGVVGVVVGSAYWINTPSYGVLFADIDPESAQAVVTKLKSDKVPYQLDEGGRTIRVAANRVDELRLEYAGQGIPAGGRIGFEIFDRTAFGTTEFLEHVNYRRALEGELARTIGTIAEVASARVHIAMPKESLFSTESQPAKASVVLKLRSSRMPSAATINGITGLVAASVESLRPESVVVVDTFGRPLTRRPDDDEAISGLQLEKQQRLEHELSAKVVSLLEPVVGEGHVRVNVTARLSGDAEEETEERWDPTTVVRSKQTSTDSGATLLAQGAAGARANAPPAASTAPAPPPSVVPQTASRTAETTNYEVSKLTRHRVTPRGEIARLSVAVIVDDERVGVKAADGTMRQTPKPRPPAELQRIQHLVASSVGIDPDRGDELTVENIAFGDAAPEPPPPDATWWQRVSVGAPAAATVVDVTRLLVILSIAALAFMAVLRPMARRALQLPPSIEISSASLPTSPPKQVKTIADLEGEIEAELDANAASKIGGLRLPVLTRRVSKAAEEEPEHVARLVRSWLSEEESR